MATRDESDTPGQNGRRELDYALEILTNLIYLFGHSRDEPERIQHYIEIADQQMFRIRRLLAKLIPASPESWPGERNQVRAELIALQKWMRRSK